MPTTTAPVIVPPARTRSSRVAVRSRRPAPGPVVVMLACSLVVLVVLSSWSR
ncbi:hypothetical protein [Streptomyces xanthochromogenes]|uniref:hypothetical protein n=1 Tax=Streptomyces xanthochromogenes TaxID=67384 RepID=UPI0034194B04